MYEYSVNDLFKLQTKNFDMLLKINILEHSEQQLQKSKVEL